MTRDLGRVLRPGSIAVIGGHWAENVVRQCDSLGFSGQVWPVNPKRESVGGRRAYRTLSDLPEAPDACFVGINRHATIGVIAELHAMGAGGAVCYASGFEEAGAADLQARLVRAAGDMPMLGPNCFGVLNYLDGVGIWPDVQGGRRVDRGVAIVTQSSNIGITLTMQRRGLPVAYVAALGNAAQVGLAELAASLLADDRVTALGLYVEGIGDAAAVAALVEDARRAGKGIACLKSGQTEAGARAAASHTASLAGSAAASRAFLRQAGIAEVAALPDLIETLKILHVHGPLDAETFCSLSCSGGEAALMSDAAGQYPLRFPDPSPEQARQLSEVLGPLVAIGNPMDYHTYIWGNANATEAVFTTMLGGYDAGFFIIDPPHPERSARDSFVTSLNAIAVASAATGKPAFPTAVLPESFDEDFADRWMEKGLAPLCGLQPALAAVSAARTPAGRPGWRPWRPLPDPATETLTEAEAKALLCAAGVPVPEGRGGNTIAGVAAAAADLTQPLALKGLGLAHKSEVGAVRLGLCSLDGQSEMAGATGYLVEEMVTDGVAELLIGLMRDPVYGATLTLGTGGVTAELLSDTETLVLPVTAGETRAAIGRLRLAPLLQGYRGRPEADIDAAVTVALKLGAVMESRPDIAEIEINPLILRREGAVAVDALIRKER